MPLPNLLVIDDDLQIRRVFARCLSRDFAVECVPDAETALTLIDGGAIFDVILCDLHLPGMSGQDFYDHVARRWRVLAERLVIMTGAEPAPDDAFAKKMGERYLMKPCPVNALTTTLSMIALPRLSAFSRPPRAAA